MTGDGERAARGAGGRAGFAATHAGVGRSLAARAAATRGVTGAGRAALAEPALPTEPPAGAPAAGRARVVRTGAAAALPGVEVSPPVLALLPATAGLPAAVGACQRCRGPFGGSRGRRAITYCKLPVHSSQGASS